MATSNKTHMVCNHAGNKFALYVVCAGTMETGLRSQQISVLQITLPIILQRRWLACRWWPIRVHSGSVSLVMSMMRWPDPATAFTGSANASPQLHCKAHAIYLTEIRVILRLSCRETFLMIIAKEFVKEIDCFIWNKALVVRGNKTGPGPPGIPKEDHPKS